MLQRWTCHLDPRGVPLPLHLRYGLMDRVAAAARSREITWLAWGLRAEALELVLEGPAARQSSMLHAVHSGTLRSTRAWDHPLAWLGHGTAPVDPEALEEAVARCHRLPGGRDPLSSPWSSHRDLLGLRHSRPFEADTLRARVEPARVHTLAGGRLPLPRPPEHLPRGGALGRLLRIAAAVHGLLPADRRSFRLFVHLARRLGWSTCAIAQALSLSPRRIRQLAAEQEPLLDAALVHLHDDRLRAVP